MQKRADASAVDFAHLAQLLKRKRAGRGLRDIAEETGVSPSTLSRLEGVRMDDVTTSTLLTLCDWLEVDPGTLIKNKSSNPTPELDLPERVAEELHATLDDRSARILAKAFAAGYEVVTQR